MLQWCSIAVESDPLAPLAGVLARQQQLRQLDLCLSTSMIEGWGTQVWPALAGQLTSLRLSLEPHLFSNDGELKKCLHGCKWDGALQG